MYKHHRMNNIENSEKSILMIHELNKISENLSPEPSSKELLEEFALEIEKTLVLNEEDDSTSVVAN